MRSDNHWADHTPTIDAPTSGFTSLLASELVDEMTPPLGSVLGSYRLLELLGQGGVGRVYRAQHMTLGRFVALKVLRPEHTHNPMVVKRFFAEARAVNQIAHENIVEITDFIEHDEGFRCIVMELLEGETLAQLQRRVGTLSIAHALPIAIQISRALAFAHHSAIVHRDLKPENVFLTRGQDGYEGLVKLLDFGIAKLAHCGQNRPDLRTAVGSILGTPEYMSPEQASGLEVDHRTDIYSLGVILYELVSGRNPFSAPSMIETITNHVSLIPPKLSEVTGFPRATHDPLERLIDQCLSKHPEDRPASMGAVHDRLREIAVGDPEEQGPRDRIRSLWGRSTRRILSRARRTTTWPGGSLVSRTRSTRRLLLLIAAGLVSIVSLGQVEWRSEPVKATGPILGLSGSVVAVRDTSKNRVTEPIPAHVLATFESKPVGARVYRAGSEELLGTTPFRNEFPSSPEPVAFDFRLKGYLRKTVRFVLLGETRTAISLAKRPTGQAPPASRRGPSQRRRTSQPTHKVAEERPLGRSDVIDPFEK